MSTSILDRDDIKADISAWIANGDTNVTIARKVEECYDLQVGETSIRRFRKRHGLNPAAFEQDFTRVDGDTGEGSHSSQGILTDPDTMLRDRGLDPAEWEITQLRANEYQGPASAEHVEKTGENKLTYYQTRFTVQKIKPEFQIVAARSTGWSPPSPAKGAKQLGSKPKLVAIVGDQQAPFHDKKLHECFLEWLSVNQPHEAVTLGDLVDYPDVSRHPLDPDNSATVNECSQAGFDIMRSYVDASTDTEWTKLPGNHDERIRNLILNKPSIRPLHGVTRAQVDDEPETPVLNIEYLCRLDELGVKYIDPRGKYDLAEHRLSNKLAVRHGWIARKGSGASALQTLEHTGYSIIIGHTHRQSLVQKTKYDMNDYPQVLTGVEAGCMCRLDTEVNEDNRFWPNYTPMPDWQQGFATAVVWPDGKFRIDLATYVNGELMWRDQRFTA